MFEYNSDKSIRNQAKHGIDFERSKTLWKDDYRIEIKANSDIENRFMVIGQIEDKHWTAIITYREENVRIISVRRSRKEEVRLYES